MNTDNIFENKKLIIFDFDGTLIDSGPDLAEALNYMLKKLDRQSFSEETVHGWVGNGALTLVKRGLLGKTEIDEDIDESLLNNALGIFLDYYKQNICVNTSTYPHVKETLKTLKESGFLLAIVTNKPYAFIEPILKTLEILEFFDMYIGGDSLDKKKPDPAPLEHTCKELNIDIKDSIMVGDSKNDILAANACDMQSIGVSYGYNYGEDINNYKPNVVVDNFKDILRVFRDER